jgi:L-fucose isomerase-like protein
MTFGTYPDVPPSLARERHVEARKLLATGVDPMAQRNAKKTAEKIAVENSLQSVACLWLAHWQDGKSPRYVDYVKRCIEASILPCLGARPSHW